MGPDLLSALGGFAVIAGLMTLVPGADTAIVLQTAVRRGSSAAFAAALGVVLGLLAWGAAAAAGLSALVTSTPWATKALALAGSAYLLYLAAGIWRKSSHPVEQELSESGTFAKGFLTNLLNPKIGVFYVAMLPPFLPTGETSVSSLLVRGLLLASVHGVECVIWFSALILGTRRLRAWLERPEVLRRLDRVTALALAAFAIRVAAGAW